MRAESRKPSAEALRDAVTALQSAHIESASLDARLLLEHVLGMRREEMLGRDVAMNAAQLSDYRALVERRAGRRPVSQLLGRREFWGMDFLVTENTLDPRPDSETLIEALLRRVPDRKAKLRILDLGTGTGCLLLALLSELPNAVGVGVDICGAALDVARSNANRHNLENRASFIRSRWCDGVEGTFDMIVSNPPYIPSKDIAALAPEVARYEPKLALDGGPDGLDCYRDILASLPTHLKTSGIAAFEIGYDQAALVAALAQASRLETAGVIQDLQGIPRCVLLQLNSLST